MKQAKNAKAKNKKSYIRPGYIIPMVYSIFTLILMVVAVYLTKNSTAVDRTMYKNIMQAAAVSVTFSPPALITCGSMAMRHRNKFPLESFLYSDAPLVLSFGVMGCQVLYLVSLTM